MRPLISARASVVKKAVAALCLALFAFVQALAASPQLHQQFHHDANKGEHSCVVATLSHGKLLLTSVATLPVQPAVLPVENFLPSVPVFVVVGHQLPPGRAPPSLLA
jgi:hypothetical protein